MTRIDDLSTYQILQDISDRFLIPDDYYGSGDPEPEDYDDDVKAEIFISRAMIRSARERVHEIRDNQTVDLRDHLRRQWAFSEKTFGPRSRKHGVIDHIRKELAEIEADPKNVEEWIDVVILAFDGALRAGFDPEQIVQALIAKQTKNESRIWPDWRSAPEGRAIEHVRGVND